MLRVALVAGLVLLAGCVGPVDPPATSIHTTAASSTSASVFTETAPPTMPPVPDRADPAGLVPELSDCWGLETAMEFPGHSNPGEPPADWGPHRGFGSDLLMMFYECNRMSWGGYERGPVRMMWETHSNFGVQPKCDNEDRTTIDVLSALFIDDLHLARFAQDELHIRTQAADFTMVKTETAGLTTTAVSWTVGGNVSRLEHRDHPGLGSGDYVHAQRMLWVHGNTTYALQLDKVRHFGNGNTMAIHGNVEAPALYAKSGTTTYASFGNPVHAMEVTATLDRYGDWRCEQPLP